MAWVLCLIVLGEDLKCFFGGGGARGRFLGKKTARDYRGLELRA